MPRQPTKQRLPSKAKFEKEKSEQEQPKLGIDPLTGRERGTELAQAVTPDSSSSDTTTAADVAESDQPKAPLKGIGLSADDKAAAKQEEEEEED